MHPVLAFTLKANVPVEVMEILPKKGTPAGLNTCNKVAHAKNKSSGNDSREEGQIAMDDKGVT